MFIHHARIYLHHTDAAGRLFFANQFYLTHEAKEHFLEHLGFDIDAMFSDPRVTFPLVHAEADYKALLKTGDKIDISVEVEKLGETSVVVVFTLLKDGAVVGTARTVNVAVDKKTQLKVPLPLEWRSRFEKALRP
ncbi:MAG: thioesterase family protein [Candidatus Omnitrophota bacterium]